MAPRPVCAYCAKPADKLTASVWVHPATATRYGVDQPWWRNIYVEAPLRNIADCRRHSNQQVVSVTYSVDATVSHFSEWDGETYQLRYGPCCSTRCCTRYARAAYRAGFRIQRTEEAA